MEQCPSEHDSGLTSQGFLPFIVHKSPPNFCIQKQDGSRLEDHHFQRLLELLVQCIGRTTTQLEVVPSLLWHEVTHLK
jgi:hypothetical protein